MLYKIPLKIALVDDDPAILDLYSFICTEIEEVEPVPFTNPREAVARILSQEFSVVVTDINMPELKGDELIKMCHDSEWRVDYIVVTGMVNLTLSYNCFRLGIEDIFIKPVNPLFLQESIARVVQRYARYNTVAGNILTEKKKHSGVNDPEKRALLKKSVIYVDDDKVARIIAKKFFTSLGWKIKLCECGLEGKEEIIKNCNSYSLIVSDHHMPDINGDEMISQIRSEVKNFSNTCILLTGSEMAPDCFSGVDLVLKKPLRKEMLLKSILPVHSKLFESRFSIKKVG